MLFCSATQVYRIKHLVNEGSRWLQTVSAGNSRCEVKEEVSFEQKSGSEVEKKNR